MSSELGPCPFCGATDVRVIRTRGLIPTYHVLCCGDDCQATGPLTKSGRAAIDYWNMRWYALDVARPRIEKIEKGSDE